MLSGYESSRSISRKAIEIRWNAYHRQDISPILSAALGSQLLSEEAASVTFTEPLVFDYLLTGNNVNNRVTSSQPPTQAGMNVSLWIWWLMQHYCDKGDFTHAGEVLKNIQADLPGFASGSWGQIAVILLHLPDRFLADWYAWVFGMIAVGIAERVTDNDLLPYRSYMQRLAEQLPIQPNQLEQRARDVVGEYLGDLDTFLTWESSRPGNEPASNEVRKTLSFAWNPFRRWGVRNHVYSALRFIPPDLPVQTMLSIKKPLQFVLQNRMQVAADNEHEAIAETFVVWGIPDSVRLLKEISSDGQRNSHRIDILQGAAADLPGYWDWV